MRAAVAWFFRLFIGRDFLDQPFPVQLRRRLEILGPTYVKLGQILSLRLDVLPEAVTQELRNLFTNVPAVPFDSILQVLEEDLQRPLDEMFVTVDPEALGSASIAQSHRARLRSGDQVLLKVVKPGIRELLYRDTALLRMLGGLLQLLIPRYQPRNIIDPRVFRDYSGVQVLCMEYLDGVPPDDSAVRELTHDERQRLIDLGATAIIRMLYEDGFFHADLHPGNLLVLSGARVGFIDLGMVGRLDPALRHNLLYLFYSVVVEDFDGAARHLSEVAQTESRSDVAGFRRAVKELCRRWRRDATFKEYSLALLILDATRLGARYRMYFPVEMVLMVKALVTYEGVGYLLDQDFNVVEVSQRHVRRIFRHRFSPRYLIREGTRIAPDIIDAVARVPLLVSESLRYLEQRTRRPPESPVRGIRATLFGGFCLVAGAILVALDGPWPLWVALLAVGVLLPLRRGN
jgi:ubiquinone biosynthesis protein